VDPVPGAANAQAIERMYGPAASDYEEIWAPLLRPYGLRLLDMLALASPTRVLDLGCGVGRLLPDIRERAPGALIVGTDRTEAMLRRTSPAFGRIVMDAVRPAFADAVFDAVVSSFVVFHLPDPRAALEAVRRSLRPGGRVAVSVWGPESSFPAEDAWTEELDAVGVPQDPAAGGPRDGMELVNSSDKLRSILQSAGFRNVTAETAEWTKPWELDAFVDWVTRLGPSRRRLEQLPADHRRAAIARARTRVASLPKEDLVDHDTVVLASGEAPAAPPA